MDHKQAMIETLNFAFPTVLTSGTVLSVAGILIGQMTSEAAIVGIGQSIGRGTILSMFLVLFVLPQILLLGGDLADKTSFSVPTRGKQELGRGRVYVDGLVRGEVYGSFTGRMQGSITGDVNLNLVSGSAAEDADFETGGKEDDDEDEAK